MVTVGLRELRQDASELVRRVENGEEIEITVAGRLAARLVPAGRAGCLAEAAMMTAMLRDAELSDLLERCRADHSSWINGDGAPYALPEDGSIFGAFGSFYPGGADAAERQRRVAAQWRRGTGTIEFVNGGIDHDFAWLAFIERGTVEFADDEEGVKRRWDLRVTEIFRRSNGQWQRLHRHADPLVDRHRLANVTALLQ